MMLFDNTKRMEESGFEGFYKIDSLMSNRCSTIPKQKGIYFVLNQGGSNFLQNSVGGHFKGKNPTVSINELKKNWIEGL